MTIQEAIKTGKRFKRPCFTYYIEENSMGDILFTNGEFYTPSKESLLATDWEVEPPKKKLIGADDIRRARNNANNHSGVLIFTDEIETLINELGLED